MRWLLLFLALLPCLACADTEPTGAHADAAPKPERQADLPRFDVLEFEISGNTVLKIPDIERTVYPFLGPSKTIEDVEAARAALERAYQKAGYLTVLVDIPEQKVAEGIVQLRVTEGKVERVRISGNRYYSRGRIGEKVPALEAGTVPYFPAVQDQLAQLNRSPDRQVTPVLRPGQLPGTVEAELKVEDKLPLHGGVELNNRQSANTEPLRLQAYLRYDNLWQREHSAAIQYLTSPQDSSQVQAISGTYVMPVPGSNDLLAFYAVRSFSDVAAIGGVTVLGDGGIVGARYIIPLPPAGTLSHSLTAGIDYKSFHQNLEFGADSVNTPINYVPLSLQYSGTLLDKRGTTQATLSANFAPRGLFGNTDEEFENNRFMAHANYLYLRGEVSREHALPHGMTLFAMVGGQVSSEPLINNEQFVAGGVDTVRGYLEAEQAGDDAYYGRVELRSPSFAPADSVSNELLVLAFLDAASLHVQDALPDQKAYFNLSSGGVGLRVKAKPHLNAALDVAVPFASAQTTRAGDTRVLFKVAYEF